MAFLGLDRTTRRLSVFGGGDDGDATDELGNHVPNLCRSWGMTWPMSSSWFSTRLALPALKPMPPCRCGPQTILSSSTEASPADEEDVLGVEG